MAATITAVAKAGGKPSAPSFVDELNVLCDNSYPAATGGYPVGAAALMATRGTIVGAHCEDTDFTGFVFQYDRANDKLRAFTSGGAAPGPLVELPNTDASLNGKNVRIVIFSK